MTRLLHVVGARPNFIKIAPLVREVSTSEGLGQVLVHTGQHYDEGMSDVFFDELEIPRPDVNLGVGSASHAQQTARVMMEFEPTLRSMTPDLVVLVGDVNSTLACALVAAKEGVPVAHVEAGLRSRDWSMPEEINRVLTDRLSDLLFTPSRDADENLGAEGIPADRIHFVGNIMIDTLRARLEDARGREVARRFDVEEGTFALVTLHRPSNVDEPATLEEIFGALAELARERPVVFPMHPRTRQNAERFRLMEKLGDVRVLKPVSYLDMLGLMEAAWMVLTDSGGIQEETTALGVPCLTLRSSTERPVTIEHGTNTLAPRREREEILRLAEEGSTRRGRIPELWDGRTASRIVDVIQRWAAGREG
jgi:UDP-N-acetylglucosamine 2-epimerase (non-hydrolysing)